MSGFCFVFCFLFVFFPVGQLSFKHNMFSFVLSNFEVFGSLENQGVEEGTAFYLLVEALLAF